MPPYCNERRPMCTESDTHQGCLHMAVGRPSCTKTAQRSRQRLEDELFAPTVPKPPNSKIHPSITQVLKTLRGFGADPLVGVLGGRNHVIEFSICAPLGLLCRLHHVSDAILLSRL